MDAVLLQQVLVNLFENALRYTPEGSPLEIEAHRAEGSAVVEVRDRGPGVNDDERARLFERFYRGTRAAGDGGVGLGLTICRAIIDAHGGSIDIANRPDGGAAVRFLLPLTAAPSASFPELAV
jgi:two-component system sensor histidine kinase KdpD